MRKRTLSLLGLVTLLMGADDTQLTTRDLPACASHTVLVYRGGKIVCAPTLPSCPGQLLSATGGSLESLGCTPKLDDALDSADRQRAFDLRERAQSLQNRIDALSLPTSSLSKFVGLTTDVTTGRIEYPGTPAGLPAAHARCAAKFGPMAHMCTMPEVLRAVLNGSFNSMIDVAKGWLYMPTWNDPAPLGEQPLAGLGDNCGGYTDGTSDHGWTGMAVDWSPSLPNNRVLHFYGSTQAPCQNPLPIACCQ